MPLLGSSRPPSAARRQPQPAPRGATTCACPSAPFCSSPAVLCRLGVRHASPTPRCRSSARAEHRFLYVAEPGIRNYVEHGGIGVLVFDIDNGHRFVRRIPTMTVPAGEEPENVKGIAASAATGRLYVSTIKRVIAFDLATDALLWNRTYEGGCDRLALSPDGRVLYVPSFEGPHWHVLDALTGDPITRIETGSGRAQHRLRAGRPRGLSGGPEVAVAVDRRSAHAHGRRARSGRSAT